MVSLAPLLSNTSQSLTVLSHEPLARRALLELKLSELTGPSCPASTCYQMQVHVYCEQGNVCQGMVLLVQHPLLFCRQVNI